MAYESDKTAEADFVTLESAIGRKLAIDSDYDDWAAFPDSARVAWDRHNGRQTMLSWRVVFQSGGVPLQCGDRLAQSGE